MTWRIVAGVVMVCAGIQSCVQYQPHVLNPVQSQAQLQGRGLGAAATLDVRALMEIGLRLNPDLETARAKAAVAGSAVLTARQRINPSISAEGGYNKTPDSAVTYAVSPSFTIETAGKRGYRILEAGKNAEAARIAVYEAEWQVRSRVRTAAVDYFAARRRLEQLHSENDIRTEIVEIYAKRVSLGEAANPELNAARAEHAALAVETRKAEGDVARGLALIAAAVGVPVHAFAGKTLDFSAFDTPPAPETIPLLQVQQAGLLHRADVRRMLVEYEAADAHLRLEVANQYPNIPLNPAYSFQEGFPAYTLGSVIESLPVFNHRQGQIAQAEAARKQLEAEFVALQAKVLSETELSRRQYTAAVIEWKEARDILENVQRQREVAVVARVGAGEGDRLDVALARIMTSAAVRTRLDALVRAQTALGGLEEAVQSPLSGVAVR